MRKLTNKEILPYLPYGLKAFVKDKIGFGDPFLDRITGIYEDLITFNDSPDWHFDSLENDTDIKLALLPLLDYKKFEDILDEMSEFDHMSVEECRIDLLPYSVMEKMFEHHIDVFSLIPKGLAVNFYEKKQTVENEWMVEYTTFLKESVKELLNAEKSIVKDGYVKITIDENYKCSDDDLSKYKIEYKYPLHLIHLGKDLHRADLKISDDLKRKWYVC